MGCSLVVMVGVEVEAISGVQVECFVVVIVVVIVVMVMVMGGYLFGGWGCVLVVVVMLDSEEGGKSVYVLVGDS